MVGMFTSGVHDLVVDDDHRNDNDTKNEKSEWIEQMLSNQIKDFILNIEL